MSNSESHSKPAPVPTSVSAPFWAAAADQRLSLQYCPSCREYIFYPRLLCGRCNNDSLQWREVSGAGTVYTFSTVRRAPTPSFQEDVPYVVGLVYLDSGVRVMAQIVGEADEVRIGSKVIVDFQPRGEHMLPVFRLAARSGATGDDFSRQP